MTKPLFADEGPEYYAAAYAHNAPFATGGPYNTTLSAQEEAAFRQWVTTNRVPFNVTASVSDYDMRGYWKSSGGKLPSGGERGMEYAWPDTYKTPYDTTFSKESKYAAANCPFEWQGDNLVDSRSGQLIFGTPTAAASSVTPAHGYNDTWHLEAVTADGSRRVVEATMVSGSADATTWDVELQPGESLDVVTHGNVTVT